MTSTKLNIKTKLKLPSGYEIPQLGFGVYQTPASECEVIVKHAFQTGYRHIDSARAYRNEQPCGDAIRSCGIPRSEIFFTSKVPPKMINYDDAKASIKSTLSQSGLDYVDLYLLHAPYGGREGRCGAWRALVEAQEQGKIRSLGISNYGVHHLNELEAYIKELERERGQGRGGVLSVGQWELHPWLMRPDIVNWCHARGVIMQAYCPIVRGERFGESSVQKLAEKYKQSPAQILLRWSLQQGFVPLPKSVTPARIEQNAALYDFELSKEDMASLATDEYAPCAWDPTTSTD